ncbi:hypothetical protein GCM10028778_14750 [Barrientosiimonas marina]|uniref:Uncharacterized protein n=1 Tax=Lentibacillus kimchii TaxID=1542911 RepID=A0ABW2UQM7_9BACI
MGYILPVNHDQYYNYQRRSIREEQNPFHIEKPARIILKKLNRQDWQWRSDTYRTDNQTALELRRPGLPEAAELYGQLTGKGREFNQSV